ncbi:unnamed protein product [Blepharisma stoltei]|uniref:Uncharacterized protein n=1 Tax=Blepharisma stoltei TaxID=1481888 RepID=A0AAU9I8M1_9CILI|nr:unnamed protein product [Blepharisma stoltei]
MFSRALGKTSLYVPLRSFSGAGAHPQKLGDKTHLETAIVGQGQYLNAGNLMLGTFCKKHPKLPVALISDKTRLVVHEFSKDLYVHDSYKNESSTGKAIFAAPKKGFFYRIDSDVLKFDPKNNKLVMAEKTFTYDHLILAVEQLYDWGKVKNLEEAVKDYFNSHVMTTAQCNFSSNVVRASREFRYGNFIYAIPKIPHKNEGTSHIFAWFNALANDKYTASQWCNSKFIITTPDTCIHRNPTVNAQLLDLAQKKGIEVKFGLQLTEIRYNNIKEYHRISDAVFKDVKTGQEVVMDYGWLATYPECKAPEVISPFLENEAIPLNPETLQHTKFENVFSFGECTNLPTINNAIAQIAQAQVVAGNVGYMKTNMPLKYHYDGTSATPIFIDMHKLIMPGFKYGWEPVSTRMAQNVDGFLQGLKQSLSFKLFAKREKKIYEKKMQGKVYGPPNWTRPNKHSSSTKTSVEPAKAH